MLLLPLAAMLLEVMGALRIVRRMREQCLFIGCAAGVHWLCSGRAFAVPHLISMLGRNVPPDGWQERNGSPSATVVGDES